jgi:energy-converting hydrogenase Eha subunit H
MGFQGLWRKIRRRSSEVSEEDDLADDIHTKLMRSYKEVPEWWYLVVLLIAMGCGMAGIGAWETYTNPAVVLFGIALALVFIIPVGIISAVTGIQVTMNVSSAILQT